MYHKIPCYSLYKNDIILRHNTLVVYMITIEEVVKKNYSYYLVVLCLTVFWACDIAG